LIRKPLLICFMVVGLYATSPEERIGDVNKRGFENLDPIILDVDGDGKPDRIIPRTFRKQVKVPKRNSLGNLITELHFITFDLFFADGHSFKSFFTYQYGTSLGDYWVYALVLPATPKAGKAELVFYTGDDTTDETIHICLKGHRFKVISRVKTTDD
jgi:hypothetical protein